MNERTEHFATRRMTLQLQCALQREAFAQATAELADGLTFVNRGVSAVRGTRLMPVLMTALSAAGLVSRAGGVFRMLSRAMFIINTVQRLKRSFR